MKTFATALGWVGAWLASAAVVHAGVSQPPAASDDGSEAGIILLVLIGAVLLATAGRGKAQPSDSEAPMVVDDDAGAGDGKY